MSRTLKKMPKGGAEGERGIIIILVAVVMLFVLGAMAALSIDVATLYTARSEAQLAADGAALAGARVLANSGMTSSTAGPIGVEGLARTIATQVAESNPVGGRNLSATGTCTPGAEISVCFNNDDSPSFITNPQITVTVQRSDLPTFFARIWGRTQLTVAATATAEAYNPSSALGSTGSARSAVAPVCVKPWLLPNIDPSGGTTIFGPTDGDITNPALLGWTFNSAGGKPMTPACAGGDCSGGPLPAPTAWSYYPGADDDLSFPPPTHSIPVCTPVLTTSYQQSIAGCVQTPIACNNNTVSIDVSPYPVPGRNIDTTVAVNCLTHATANLGDADEVDTASGTPPSPPFQFLAGAQNPVAGAHGIPVIVSSSLVTVPVFDVTNGTTPPIQILGFVQLFLNPDGLATPTPGYIDATIINMAGCGTGTISPPVIGNGASPVVVRLISSGP